MLKALVTAFTLLLASLHCAESGMTMEQMKKIAVGFRNVCQPKTGVDVEILEGMQKGEFPEDKKFQCYLKCVMGLLRTLRNGKVDLDMLLKQVDAMVPENFQERTRHVAKHCSSIITSNDMCEIAYQFVKCNWETDAEVFFFP